MSTKEIILNLQDRNTVRKGLNSLRNNGQIPAVIHQPGKDSINVSGSKIDVIKVYKEAGRRHPVTVKLDNKKFLTIIKSVDTNPKNQQIRHVVFGVIKQNEKVETEVSIELTGDSPAEKAGLQVNQVLDTVHIEAFPKDLPDNLSVSIDKLENIGDKITISDIVVPSGVSILAELEHPVVIVEEVVEQPEEEPEIAETAEAEAQTDSKETTTENN